MARRSTLLALAIATLAASAAQPSHAAVGDAGLRIAQLRVAPYVSPPRYEPSTGDNAGFPPQLATAGAHPNLAFETFFCPWNGGASFSCTDDDKANTTNDLVTKLPTGMFGSPTASVPCPTPSFLSGDCRQGILGPPLPGATIEPDNAKIGYSYTKTFQAAVPVNLFNVATEGFEPARIGTGIVPAQPFYPRAAEISIRTDSDYGIDSLLPNLPDNRGTYKFFRLSNVLCAQAGCPNVYDPSRPYFLTNPTSCDPARPATLTMDANSHQHPELRTRRSDSFQTTDCGTLTSNYDPTVDVQPETTQAGAPSGYDITINVPETLPGHPDRISPHLYSADTLLPKGVRLSPTAAKSLVGCTDDQFGVTSQSPFHADKTPIRCPEASKIGTVEITVPILDPDPTTPSVDPLTGQRVPQNIEPIKGFAYFAQPDQSGPPTAAHPWHLLLGVEDGGVRVKLRGDVTIDPATGQLRTVFEDQPQTPFTKLKLHLNGGSDAVLMNPRTCGTNTTSIVFRPWSMAPNFALDPGPAKDFFDNLFKRTSSFTTTGCSDPEPFAPTAKIESDPPDAGASPDHSKVIVERADGDQLIEGLQLSLPAGAVGSLASVPSCSFATAQAGDCGVESKIGTIRVQVGGGAQPLETSGSVYLADPGHSGDAATVAVDIPAKVGPIDLGHVVSLNRVKLRQRDAGLDIESDPIPTELYGVPLPLKRIEIDVDRKGFFRNPTGCDQRPLGFHFDGDLGAAFDGSVATQATNCGSLPFSPSLRLIAGGKGATARFGHTPLKAIVTQNEGEANIAKAHVVLPQVLKPDTVNLNKPGALCKEFELLARACPAASQVGMAKATTPLLPEPLSGPVYIFQNPGQILPRLAVLLGGRISIELDAQSYLQPKSLRTVNDFEAVPDVPVTSFELNITGGKSGILSVGQDLCANPSRADAEFTAHSGKQSTTNPLLEVEGCESALGKVKLASKNAKVSKRGVVKLKLSCPPGRDCDGKLTLRSGGVIGSKRFSLASGSSGTVAVRLNVKGRRKLARKKRLGVRAVITGAGVSGQSKVQLRSNRR